MASQGISIKMDIEESGVLKGAKNVDEALEKINDQLGDVGKEGTRDLEKIEASLKDINRASLQTGTQLEKTFSKNVKGSLKDAESGMGDFKQEANQTAKETAASFDGSADSIVGMFQEVSANALSGFGPAGAVAGLALAAGIGIATSAFGANEEQAKAAKEEIAALGKELIDTGDLGTVSIEYMVGKLKDFATEGDTSKTSLAGIRKTAKELGLDFKQLAQSYAGGTDALGDQIARVGDLIAAAKDYTAAQGENANAAYQASRSEVTALEKKKVQLEAIKTAEAAARQEEKDWYESGGPQLEAKAALISSINTAYDDVVASVTDFKDAESGVLDVDAYLAAMQARADALLDYQNSVTASDLTGEQRAALDALGLDAAEVWMAGYEKATPGQKTAMKKFLTESASESSGAAKTVIDEAFAKPIKATIAPEVSQNDIDAVNRAIKDGIVNQKVRVTVEAYNRQGQRVD
jgi:hypothetical protein